MVKLRRDIPEPRHRSFTTDDALADASTEELLLELRRRIIRPRERRHDTWDDSDDGLEPQAVDSPDESARCGQGSMIRRAFAAGRP
ncbi:MAG: hypothetical protein WB989_22895 [Mycobacterium sp.]